MRGALSTAQKGNN